MSSNEQWLLLIWFIWGSHIVCCVFSDNVLILQLYCKQLQERSKQMVCFWKPYSEHSLTLGIYDSHGRERKLLNVDGAHAVLDAQEMDFGELYIITLCNIQLTHTLFGMSDQVKFLKLCFEDAFNFQVHHHREQQNKWPVVLPTNCWWAKGFLLLACWTTWRLLRNTSHEAWWEWTLQKERQRKRNFHEVRWCCRKRIYDNS